MSDPLFVGLTRPSIILGIPSDAFKFLMVFSSIFFVGWKSLWSITIFPVFYFPVYLICLKDPSTFYLLWLWLKTKGKSTFRRKYFSSTASIFTPTRPRGI